MLGYILFLIPFFSLLIAFTTILAVMWSLKANKDEFLNRILSEFSPEKTFSFLNSEEEMGDEIEMQINQRLDAVIIGFKKQIPMVSIFLSRSKEDELKETAKTELMRLIPGIKDRFIKKVNEVLNPVNGPLEGVVVQKLIRVLDDLWKQVKYKIILIVSCVGLVLGLIELGIVYFLATFTQG